MRRFDATTEAGTAGRGRWAGALAVVLAVAVTGAACSSGPAAPTIDKAAAAGLISQAYQTLFNFQDKTVAGKVAVIANGASIESSLNDALSSPLSNTATGAKVDSATVLSDAQCTTNKLTSPCAKVAYEILGSGGSTILVGPKGFAVYKNGKWLVAKVTICALLGLFYSAEGKSGAPPGC